MADVFIDGKLEGTTKNPIKFVETLISKRRNGKVSKNLNVLYNNQEEIVYVHLDKNRLRRPLVVVKDGKPILTDNHLTDLASGKLKWTDLLEQGIVEEIDALEEEGLLVAMQLEEITKKTTHLEINPALIYGMNTSLVPYSNFTTSSRLLRGQKNQNQGTSIYTTNYMNRLDTNVNILHYSQKPIVNTFTQDLFGDHIIGGQNLVVAFINYDGYNISDGVVINRASVDRGMWRVSHYRPYAAERLRYSGGQVDEIRVPDKEVQGYSTEDDYKHLDVDGLVNPETHVRGGEAIVGKTSPPRFLSRVESFSTAANIRKDTSVKVKYGERGVVSKVIVTESKDGNPLINVEVRDTRNAAIGDKVASRHGQKGIISHLVNPEDMPFTASGVVPDILFSPFGMRRMTVSHIIEAIGGKTAALEGRYVDGTPFGGEDSAELRKSLEKLGFRENGTETMYDGRTGKKFEAKIFVGNLYYMRLKHQVADKIQSRARGRVALLTRQPTAGKAMEGGLRFGDMEKDTLIAHGASLLLKERFDSDKEIVFVGERSGDIAAYDAFKKKAISFDEKEKVHPVEMSYAFKLLVEELKSMGIRPQLKLKDKFKK
tara:strand:- start:1287 stop:3083 length:1797 start_codon:yes stop_codon:yes gene_type:complete